MKKIIYPSAAGSSMLLEKVLPIPGVDVGIQILCALINVNNFFNKRTDRLKSAAETVVAL